MMPIFISTGIGVGVLAGVVSGVCYLLVNSIRWSGRSDESNSLQVPVPEPYDKNRCAVCRQVFPPALPARGATCRCCGLKVCRGRGCSDWDQGAKKWDCFLCQKNRELHLRTGQWFVNQIQRKFRTAEPEHLRVDKLIRNADRGRESPELPGSRRSLFDRETQREVREFVEQLVSSMVGGSLDDVIVSRMYRHTEYLPLGEGENPGVAHVTLKRLVQRVIEEAMNLPDLLDLSGVAERKSDSMGADFVDPNTYEELLATAVLNKVIESYQNKLNCGDQSSGINSGGSDLDSNSNVLYSKNNENIPVNNTRVESEFSSQSSLEPLSHDESYQSESSGNQTEPPMSLTIEECIEEVTTGDSSIDNHESNLEDYYISANLDYLQNHRVPFPDFDQEDTKDVDKINDLADISMNGTHSPTSNTWEENWLFQKKRLRSSPTPVPMLVPSPTAEFRALIGDRDAEDTTDLSEAGSDMDDSIEEPIEVPNILVQSKKIIGGKNPNLIDYEDEVCNLPVNNEDILKAENVTVKGEDIIEPPTMFVATSEEDVDGKILHNTSEELGSLGVVRDIKEGIKELHDLAEAKNVELLDNTGLSDSGSQKDRELAEQYDAAPQRVIESPVVKNEETKVDDNVNTESPKPIPAPRNIPLDGLEEPEKSPTICEPPRPGSIAEREHLKWQNAAPLANNPYSQEAIEKRKASITSTLLPTRMIPEPFDDDDVPPPTPTSPMPTNQGTPLQVVLGSGQPDYKRYGRDYYINDAKKSAGTRKKQELLHQSEDIPDVAQAFIKKVTSPKEPESPDYLHKSFIENNEPIFRAKPIIIDETDSNITHNAVREDILNEEDDDHPGLKLSRPTSLNLDYEDTRVYNISTGTTKIINGFENKQNVRTPPSTPVDHCPVQSVPLAVEKMKFENKLSPPIRAPEWTQRSAGLVHSINSSKKPTSPFEEKRDDFKDSSRVHEKSTKDAINEKIVEETVVMPSVRELAKNFLNDKKDEINKTKTINLKEAAEPAIIKHKDSNIYQVNSSLTARSVPKQFREDLKSTSTIEVVSSIKRAKTPEPVSQSHGEPTVVRPRSRTGSPVVRSGSLRNSIAFFEQLKNK